MKNIEVISREAVMNLIEDISPTAKDYINSVYEDTLVLHAQGDRSVEGVFLKAVSENLCVYYAHYADDSSLSLLDKISEEIESSVSRDGELCFNVHGNNKRIMQLVQSKGFKLDMEGYILKYSLPTIDPIDLGELTTCEVSHSVCRDYVELFEAAYEQLNKDNGWDTKSYSKEESSFCHMIKELSLKQDLKSFWKEGSLIGCYIIDGSFITDIVVHPQFQNKGYGSLMLRHCIHLMREEKGISDIYLRITKSNSGAKRLYERMGFTTISHFAEHSYQGK